MKDLVEEIPAKQGFISVAVIRDGDRIGFDIIDDNQRSAVLSRVDKLTNYPVGRYCVDINSLDNFLESLSGFTPDQLLYVDEIAPMALYSEPFKQLVTKYLDSGNDCVITIASIHEHPFITEVKARKDMLHCVVTPKNRLDLKVALSAALANRILLRGLNEQRRQEVLQLAQSYLTNEQYISFRKLFNNALRYVNTVVQQNNAGEFSIPGDHGMHYIQNDGKNYLCDCDLFNGRGKFKDQAGECSHIQAVKLSLS